MAAEPQDAPPHAGRVVRRVLLRRNIAVDAETAQLVADASEPRSSPLRPPGHRADARAAPPSAAQSPHLDGLRIRADAGDQFAVWRLMELLIEHGDPDEAQQILRAQADVGDDWAAQWLAYLLAKHGDLGGLYALADAGNAGAARHLTDLLIEQGRGEEAERLRRFGLNPDGSISCA